MRCSPRTASNPIPWTSESHRCSCGNSIICRQWGMSRSLADGGVGGRLGPWNRALFLAAHLVFQSGFELVGGPAELAQCPPDRTTDVRQLPWAEDDQRHEKDENQLLESERAEHCWNLTLLRLQCSCEHGSGDE